MNFEMALSGDGAGGVGSADLMNLVKALQAGSGAGLSSVGGRTLVKENLESALHLITAGNQQYRNFLYKILKPKSAKAKAIMHEFITLTDYGVTGATSQEVTGTNIDATDAQLARAYAQVRFFRNKRSVSHVIDYTDNELSPETIQTNAAINFLTQAIEQQLFIGNTAMDSTQWTGIGPTCDATGNVINLAGSAISKLVLDSAAENVAGYGSFGVPSDLFMPIEVQTALDTVLVGNNDRVIFPGNAAPLPPPVAQANGLENDAIYYGAPAAGYRSSFGIIKFRPHNFTEPARYPYRLNGSEVATSTSAPATPTGLAITNNASAGAFANSGAGGLYTGGGVCNGYNGAYAGVYQYRVSAVNSYGESILCAAVAGTVTSGNNNALTWTAVSGASYYKIYRSLNGGSATYGTVGQPRWIANVSTNAYVDTNQNISGCYTAYLLDTVSDLASSSIGIADLAPMSKYQLPMGDTQYYWMHFAYLALCIYNSNKMQKIKNIAPAN